MFEQFLQDIGLSEKEAKVYISLLQNEDGLVGNIAKETKINRTTVYPILESLSKKGLIAEIEENGNTHYQAEPPERLETFLEKQRVGLEEKSKILEGLLPQFKSMQQESGEKPVVRYFEGREGITNDEILQAFVWKLADDDS